MTQLLYQDLSQVGQLLFTQGDSQNWIDLMTVEPIKYSLYLIETDERYGSVLDIWR